MKVSEILNAKGASVVTVRPHETIDALAHRFKLERIGSAVVSSDGSSIDGIISERDVVRGLAEHREELLAKTVADLMTRSVSTCGPDDSVKDIMRIMTQKRIRHLPVTAGGKLIGIISIGDVVKNRLDDMELEANVLRDSLIAHQ
jgi:CBS domain-containing protein